MGRNQCRIWWPKQLLSREPSSDLLLFGWCLDSKNSIDVVVAHAAPASEISVQLHALDLQEIFQSINSKMPMSLQEVSTFCMLGHCAVHCRTGDMETMPNQKSDVNGNYMEVGPCMETSRTLSCGCEILNQSVEPHRESLIKYGNWVQLLCKPQEILYKESRWIPQLHHMHQNGHSSSNCDVHLMIYEPPTYGKHHFSVSSWGYCVKAVTPTKKPNWFNELNKKSSAPNLEAVVCATNCASVSMVSLNGAISSTDGAINFYIISRLLSMLWYLLAVVMASLSTAIYIFLQLFHNIMRFGLHTYIRLMMQKVFTETWNNVHIRACQFLYWPIFLQGAGLREHANVEYAHMAALRKHSIWSSIAIDVIMGIGFGIIVLANVESLYSGTCFVTRNVTNNLLRSGCVWLMGIPAGFKLNTELAEVLGIVSLNAIQVFSTLWFFLGSFFYHFLKVFALTGIFFGLTVPAALCIDMLKAATLHVQTLHWLTSVLYSRQIQALASLWRLFRGRKWNPLRQRLDSYDYTVEQHVVGSLLFTPLLLLLPTTSVFYIFFTILNTTMCFICIIIEVVISILHATPYAEILLWVTRRRRFPSGIWFEFISLHHGVDYSQTTDSLNSISLLHSNYATIVQIVTPSYRDLFQSLTRYIGGSSAYGVLSGQRGPSTLQINPQPALPWMQISCKEYWRLCHSSILACRSSWTGVEL